MNEDKAKEDKAKKETIEKAKSFIKELQFAVGDVAKRLESNEDNTQINAVIHAYAMSECLKQYEVHLKEAIKKQASLNEG